MNRKDSPFEVETAQLMSESEGGGVRLGKSPFSLQWDGSPNTGKAVVAPFLQPPLAGVNWAWVGKLIPRACGQEETHSLPGAHGQGVRRTVPGWITAVTCLLGTWIGCLVRSKSIGPCGMPAMSAAWSS